MSTYVLIHGASSDGWLWHRVEPLLRAAGHDVVAPDLPCSDDAAGLDAYVDAVVAAVGERRDLIVVGQSLGGFTAPLVVDRLGARELVLLAAMVPRGTQPAERARGRSAPSRLGARRRGEAARMSLPPDEPTRPLGAPPADPVYRERERVVAPDDGAFRAEVMDRLRSLRVWVAVATLLSLLALAAAALAYLEADEDRGAGNRDGVRETEVEALEERVNSLEARRDEGVGAADLNALEEEQAALATQVEDLAAQVEANAQPAPTEAEDAEAREAISGLEQAVADLDARVQALEDQQAP